MAEKNLDTSPIDVYIEPDVFKEFKTRVEASRQAREKYKPTDQLTQEYFRLITELARKFGDTPDNVRIRITGYIPKPFTRKYQESGGSEILEEQLVGFVRQKPDGTTELLKDENGQVWGINADLYDLRSQAVKQRDPDILVVAGVEPSLGVLPRINGNGEFCGIVTLED